MKTVRYIPRSKVEIDAFKRMREQQETRREERTNLTLISLRKKNLSLTAQSESLKRKIVHFNKVIRARQLSVLVKIIHYLVSDFNQENEGYNATE